jgi:hypothetical protein
MRKLRVFLANEELHVKDDDIRSVLAKLLKMKEIIGNLDMDIHFFASCLAESFLKKKHNITIDLNKAVGSSGLDIELEEIIAEIKTTTPYLENDFGAKQKETIMKDLKRLENSDEKHKYFFVVDGKTDKILKQKYSKHYPSVEIVNLMNEGIET